MVGTQAIWILSLLVAFCKAAEVELPNVKLIDCKKAGLNRILGKSKLTCMVIRFKSTGITEYTGLKPDQPGIETILSGPLFKVVEDAEGKRLEEIEDSRVSVTLFEDDHKDAQVMIHGSEGTDELFQMRVCLKSGEAHADTFPQDGVNHFDDEDTLPANRMTPMERMALLAQYKMNMRNMPSQMDLKVQMVIEGKFTEKFGTNSETRVAGVFNHMKTFFQHSSLDSKFNLIRLPTKTLTQDLIIKVSNRDVFGKICADMVDAGQMPDAHTYILMSPANEGGLYGIANGGWDYGFGVCASNRVARASINWYETDDRYEDDLLTALTVVHETGHNLGMYHDFEDWGNRDSRVDSNGNNCKGIAAFMDYIFPPYTTSNPMPNKWSGCSVDDFRAHYQLFKQKDGQYCLEASTEIPTTPPPTDSVCVNVKVTTKAYGNENSWTFGSCSSKQTYANNKEYEVECCQPAGNYQLTCKDSYGDGWHGGFIQIGSSATKHCQDFDDGSSKEVASVAHEGSSGSGENVCVNLMLKTKDYGEEISWSFGSCSSQGTYESHKVYNIECCQPAGMYDFKCEDSYGDGWHGAFVKIGGSKEKLCSNFKDGASKTIENVSHSP